MSRMRRSGKRALVPVAGAVVIAIAVAACGSSGSTGTSGSPTSAASSSSTGGSGMDSAKKLVASAEQPTTYSGSTDSLDRGKVQGKTVYFIEAQGNNVFVSTIAQHFKEAGDLIGLRTTILDGHQNPSDFNAYIQQGIRQKAAAIVLQNVGLEVPNALAAAKAAGIPVIVSGETSANLPRLKDTAAAVGVNTYQVGQIQAALATVLSNGKVKAVGLGGKELPQDPVQWQGQKDGLQQFCGSGCSYSTSPISLNTFQTTTASSVRAMVASDPNLNWLFPDWDILATYVAAGLRQANAEHRVQFSSWNGIQAALDMVRSGTEAATVGVSLKQWGWQLADTTARLIAGQQTNLNVALPTRLLTPDMLKPLSPWPPSDGAIYGNDSVYTAFKKAWGVS